MRAKIAEYKQAGAQPTLAFKIGDKVQVGADQTIYTIEQHPTRENDVNITWMSKKGKQSTAYTKGQINMYLTKENPYWKLVEPKPVETKKPRLMLCVDMNDSPAEYTVGKVYELKSEDDYYYFKRNDGGVRGILGGMFKHRFIELKDGVVNSIKVLCINNSAGYRDLLTVGKTYEAVPSTDGEEFWTIPVSDKGTQAGAYKHRFTVLTDETAQREWKVGDTVTSKFLNDSEIEKEFHGYDKGWNKYSSRMFVKDRKIEEIGEREGKTGARISGTMDIWITLESLELHP
jgi:hypothetical protein